MIRRARTLAAFAGFFAALTACSGPGGVLGTVRHPSGDIGIAAYPAGTSLVTSATAPYTVTSTFSVSVSEAEFGGPYAITMYSWNNHFNEPCFEPHLVSASIYTFAPDHAAAAGAANPCAGGEVETALITDGKGHDTYFSFEAATAIVSSGTAPSPGPTGSAAPTACSQGDPNQGSVAVTGAVQPFSFPACGTFTIDANLPPNGAAGDALSLASSSASQFSNTLTAGLGTPVLSLALAPGPSPITFSNAAQSLLVTLASPSRLGSGSYTMELRENGAVVETVSGLTPDAGSLSVNVHPPSGIFAVADYVIIFYEQ